MAKQERVDCAFEIGEKRSEYEVTKTYFFGVRTGGREGSLFDLQKDKVIKVNWTRGGEEDPVTMSRQSEVNVTVFQECIIKLFTSARAFGDKPLQKAIYLKVGPGHPKIRLTGYKRFGKFVGNATVMLELSRITAEELKADFNMEILSVGDAADEGQDIRQLIF